MIRLFTLGATDLQAPAETSPEQLLAQPKRLALLAYLALATPTGPHRRDVLVTLFWPESNEQRARDALRQAVRYIRRALGDEILINHGRAALEISPALWCDVHEFERLLSEGRPAEALALYRGELLHGFHADGTSPEFEHWLHQRRLRLSQRASEAISSLIAEAESAGDAEAAVRWGRRALQLDPFDEKSLRRLLNTLAEADDLSGALEEYDRFATHLAAVEGGAPTVSMRQFAASLRERWEAGRQEESVHVGFAAPGEPAESVAIAPAPEVTPTAAPGAELMDELPRGARRRGWSAVWRLPFAAAAVLTLLGFGVALAMARPDTAGMRDPAALPDTLVAVLPFQTEGADPEVYHLVYELAGLLSERLSGEATLHALEQYRVLRAWNSPGNALPIVGSPAARNRLARDLGVNRFVVGEVVGSEAHLMLRASVISAIDGRSLAEAAVEGPRDSLGGLADRLAAQLLLRLSGEPDHRSGQLSRVPLNALSSYLRGQHHYRRAEYEKSTRSFRRALEADSTFALAALALVSGLRWTGSGEEVERQVARALGLRHQLDLPDQALLAALASGVPPHTAPVAQQLEAWQHAVTAQPGNAEARFYLGDIYYHWGRALEIPGYAERARLAFEKSMSLSPTFEAPLLHRLAMATGVADRQTLRQLHGEYLRLEHRPGSPRLATALLGSEAERRPIAEVIRQAALEQGPLEVATVVATAQLRGVMIPDVPSAIRALQVPGQIEQEDMIFEFLYPIITNSGRYSTLAWLTARRAHLHPASHTHHLLPVMAALYGDDHPAAAAHADTLIRMAGYAAHPPAHLHPAILCGAEQWKVRHSDTTTTERTLGALRDGDSGSGESDPLREYRERCSALIQGERALVRGRPREAIDVLEPLSRALILEPAPGSAQVPNLLLAEAYEAAGEPRKALEVLARRPHHPRYGLPYLSSSLLREARLHTALGDTAAAVRAYTHYLVLRNDPDPFLRAKTARVRQELGKLTGARPSREPRRPPSYIAAARATP